MTGEPPIRVLLVDDHIVVRESLAVLLNMQPDLLVVGQAGTGAQGMQLFRDLLPDVTLMDLSLPDIDGVAAIRAIRRDFPHACIAVLTSYDNDQRILNAVRGGARTYLTKTMRPIDLYRTIRELAVSGTAPRAALICRASRSGRVSLSDRERLVLERMACGDTNGTIAEHMNVSVNTVKTQVRSVLRKLEAGSRTEAVTLGLELGIVERRRTGRTR